MTAGSLDINGDITQSQAASHHRLLTESRDTSSNAGSKQLAHR